MRQYLVPNPCACRRLLPWSSHCLRTGQSVPAVFVIVSILWPYPIVQGLFCTLCLTSAIMVQWYQYVCFVHSVKKESDNNGAVPCRQLSFFLSFCWTRCTSVHLVQAMGTGMAARVLCPQHSCASSMPLLHLRKVVWPPVYFPEARG